MKATQFLLLFNFVTSFISNRFPHLAINTFENVNLELNDLAPSIVQVIDDENDSYDRNCRRVVGRVMYDGTRYHGWQAQTNSDLRTIQQILARTFSKRFRRNIRVVGASRTDMGVHSKGQCIHFDIPDKNIDLEYFQFSLNQILPEDIKVYNLSWIHALGTTDPFHATASAESKLYIYRFCTNSFVDPCKKRYYAHAYLPMDMKLFKECLNTFIGTYDFKSFGNRIEHTIKDFENTKSNVEFSTIRTIYNISLEEDMRCPGYYEVKIHLKSALYQMIRNIIGSSFQVANRRLPYYHLDNLKYLLIDAPGRLQNKAKSAPPEGLTLEHVYYKHY